MGKHSKETHQSGNPRSASDLTRIIKADREAREIREGRVPDRSAPGHHRASQGDSNIREHRNR
jgi:hypothetical protein